MRTSWIGYAVVGIAIIAVVVPASFATDSQAADHEKAVGTANEAEERQSHEDMSDAPISKAWQHMGAFVAEPIGRFRVGPEFVDGETIYVLRTPASQGITSVEVSTTPFEPDAYGTDAFIGNPDEHPAGW